MTIFFHLVKEVLKKQVMEASEDSVSLDRGPTNSVCSFFGVGRDIDLSRKKREIYDELKTSLNNLQSSESDNENIEDFRTLIKEAKKKAKTKSDEKGLDEGSFGKSIDKILNLLTLIEEKLRGPGLWDIKYSSEPYNIFCKNVAQYILKKISDNQKKNPLEVLLNKPQLTSASKISIAKDEMLSKEMESCRLRINRLRRISNLDQKLEIYWEKEDIDAYNEGVKDIVLMTIEKVRIENKRICEESKLPVRLPIIRSKVFSVEVSPDFQYSPGRLEKYMKDAKEAILSAGLNDEEQKEEEPISAAIPEP